jgi:hypothetical protein
MDSETFSRTVEVEQGAGTAEVEPGTLIFNRKTINNGEKVMSNQTIDLAKINMLVPSTKVIVSKRIMYRIGRR